MKNIESISIIDALYDNLKVVCTFVIVLICLFGQIRTANCFIDYYIINNNREC